MNRMERSMANRARKCLAFLLSMALATGGSWQAALAEGVAVPEEDESDLVLVEGTPQATPADDELEVVPEGDLEVSPMADEGATYPKYSGDIVVMDGKSPETEEADMGELSLRAQSGSTSVYSLVFEYGDQQCEVIAPGVVPLLDVIGQLGIVGEVQHAYVSGDISDDQLSVEQGDYGVWYVNNAARISGTVRVVVVVEGVEYEIEASSRWGTPYYDPAIGQIAYADPCNDLPAPDSNRVTLNEGWYAFAGKPTFTERVSISGNVNLILPNGQTLTCRDGIFVPKGSSLTIWAQSDDRDVMGKLLVSASELKAGIGAVEDKDGGPITINGGYVVATGGNKSAGIGGAYDADSGSVTINGGYVSATGGTDGAGIGSGYSAECGSVTITGGEVYATGGDYAAGIGGGYKNTNGTVTITDCIVHAQGIRGGAGIGSGLYADCENDISIVNATVTAFGSHHPSYSHPSSGAGIGGGGGNNSDSGDFECTVTITNSTVVARAYEKSTEADKGDGGAGIGAGGTANAKNGKVLITNSVVTAIGGRGGAGIGGGSEMHGGDKGHGGEGAGLVEIKGLKTVIVAQAGTNASAIGHGDNDRYMGELKIDDGLKVQAGNDGTNYEGTFSVRLEGDDDKDGRVEGCRWRRSARIEACDHPNPTIISMTSWGHLQGACEFCKSGKYFMEQQHKFGDDGACTVCGYASQELVTISYYAGGGTGKMEAATYMPELVYTAPECDFGAPAGKAFAGWELVYDKTGLEDPASGIKRAGEEFLVPPVSTLTMKATWGTPAIVTFDANGGTGEMKEATAATGTRYAMPGCAFLPHAGSHFTGWKVNGKGDVLLPYDKTYLDGDVTLVAQWSRSWVVTFDAGDGGLNTTEVSDGDFATQPDDPEREGFVFLHWTLDGEPYDFSKPVTGDLTLEATWARLYTITFKDSDGKVLDKVQVPEGEIPEYVGDAPKLAAHAFAGWSPELVPATSDATYVATYAEWHTVTTYFVEFDTAGGNEISNQSIVIGATATRPIDPTRDGFTFLGWRLGNSDYDFSTPVTHDLTLTAAWEKKSYSVTFLSAELGVLIDTIVSHGNTVTPPTDPVRKGWVFKGWTYDGADYDFETPVTHDLTLMAKWEEVGFKVTFLDSDGTVLQEGQVMPGEVPSYEGNAPSLGDRTFTGWDPELAPATANATYTATYLSSYVAEGPLLMSHSLTLSGAIGLDYFMSLDSLSKDDLAGCRMEFSVGDGGKQTTHVATFDPDFRDAAGEGYYGFSCPTTSVQMADTIRAKFFWGDESMELPDYSVRGYVEDFDTYQASHPGTFSDSSVALVHAVADYGHHAQPYLSRENNWAIGSDYAKMDTFYADSYAADLTSVKSALAAHAASGGLSGTPIASASMRLRLDSGTSVEALLSPTTEERFSATDVASVAGAFPDRETTVKLLADGRISVRVDSVSAHLLATPLSITYSGREIMRLSALSFANNALADSPDAVTRDAMCALYRYYEAAVAYAQTV